MTRPRPVRYASKILKKNEHISKQTSNSTTFSERHKVKGEAKMHYKIFETTTNATTITPEGLKAKIMIQIRSHRFQVSQASVTEVASFSSRLILFDIKHSISTV